jgi:hypothetical protein
VRQVLSGRGADARYVSADEPALRDRTWIAQEWETARKAARDFAPRGAVLALDEIQKIPGWSETVKRLWDEDTATGIPLRVIILGSAPLLVRQGLADSLAGRFELLHLPHWSFPEMHAAFGWDLERFLFFGAYPGAAPLIDDPARWAAYVKDSLIETTISRDVLLLTRVDKPALLRRLFDLGCRYSGQIVSYTKMLGQLHDAGNTTTLAHYLDLMSAAGMLTGLQKFSGSTVRQRASTPKLLVLNTALMTAQSGKMPADVRRDGEFRGRLIETAIGAHLANEAVRGACELFYWRHRDREVDFVIRRGDEVSAIEVKSGRPRDAQRGIAAFDEKFHPRRVLLVGADGIPIEEFLSQPVEHWLG